MKANKAPEKIWIDNLDEGFWFDSPSGNKSIEYTRTDAFIEKACDYLSYHLDTSKIDVNYKFDLIEEFRKYIKG